MSRMAFLIRAPMSLPLLRLRRSVRVLIVAATDQGLGQFSVSMPSSQLTKRPFLALRHRLTILDVMSPWPFESATMPTLAERMPARSFLV